MGATTSAQLPFMTSNDISAALNRFKTPSGRQWGFDVFDCPVDLVEHLADITSVHNLRSSSSIAPSEALRRATVIGDAMAAWEVPDSLSNNRLDIIEVWRRGILLYLIRIFQLPGEIFGTSDLLDDIFWRAKRLSSKKNRQFATSWPLFQAGLCLDGDSQRKQWLCDDFRTHFQSRGCCNAQLAVEVLESTWSTGDRRVVQSGRLLF